MSKELIERLRNTTYYSLDPYEAADRIEQLKAEVAAIKVEVAHWKSNHATEVRRARILKERTDMPIDRVAAYEKWKEDQNLLSGFYDLTGLMQSALEEDTARIGELREQLAASQLREQQLREALQFLNSRIVTMDLGGVVERALSLPSDTTSLEALIQKTGEVTIAKARQACIDLGAKGIDYFNYTSFVEVIDNLPTVTINDLK